MGVKEGIDAQQLAETGWGVLFASQDEGQLSALKEALGELLALRREQAGDRYREYDGPDALQPGETRSTWLARHGVGPGPADPDKVPYHLLLAGDLEAIPYRFQYQLDVQYAVGRLHFDSLDEYAHYARSVVTAERGGVRRPRRAVLFGVENPDDQPTYLTANALVRPLAEALATAQPDWQVEAMLGDQATKEHLGQLLGGEATGPGAPALLLAAGHGLAFPLGAPQQEPCQGALLCQDWPGPNRWRQPIPPDFFFAASDVAADARLAGLIAFLDASYSAGTPQADDFARQALGQSLDVAPHAFVARLPQRLLGHPAGGALAVVGHADRAWGYSLRPKAGPGLDAQRAALETALRQLMAGAPVGLALEPLSERYAELATTLSGVVEDIQYGLVADDEALAGMWTAGQDAHSYVLVGDPAVRLAV